jgi:hypothetical protein
VLRNLLAFAAVFALSGCPQPGSGGTGGGDGTGGGGTGGMGGSGGGGEETYAVSSKANVKFKRSVRMTNDFANALSLPADQLCKELGQYQCTTLVHPLALGGTDPYGIGLYEPLPFTGMASPLVTDRVALSGCQLRTSADLAAGSSAVIWKGVTPDGAGKLNIDASQVDDALDALYRRTVLRHPTASEVGHLKQLYRDIEATGKPAPGQAWMTLSCFAVLSSVEALFY